MSLTDNTERPNSLGSKTPLDQSQSSEHTHPLPHPHTDIYIYMSFGLLVPDCQYFNAEANGCCLFCVEI